MLPTTCTDGDYSKRVVVVVVPGSKPEYSEVGSHCLPASVGSERDDYSAS